MTEVCATRDSPCRLFSPHVDQPERGTPQQPRERSQLQELKRAIRQLSAAAALALYSSVTPASLIGDTITCTLTGAIAMRFVCVPASAVLGPSQEFELVVSFVMSVRTGFVVDIGAGSVTLTNTSSEQRIFDALPITLIFGSLDDSTGDIVGVANFTTTNTSGISASDVSFTEHSVTFQLGSSIWAASGGTASFDLVTSPSQVVTEPTSATLLGIAVGVLGLSLWLGKRDLLRRIVLLRLDPACAGT